MNGLLRIGELARLGGVSVKALRFYDEQGLLRPEHVDPVTGYRYYTLDQAKTLAVITNLRIVDFSIAEIAALLGGGELSPERFQSAIKTKQEELQRAEADLADKIRIADMLARSAANRAIETPPTFKLAPIENQRVYSLKQAVPHLGAPVKDMFESAEAAVAEYNARAPSAPFLIFHDPPTVKTDLTVEVCIPLTEETPDAVPAAVIPGSSLACAVVYAGGYFKTDALFPQMTDWIETAGLKAAGPLREVYHRFGADQEDYRLPSKMTARNRRDYLTELQIPISQTIDKQETD